MSEHPDRRARIAIVGAGWWSTQAHLPSLLAYPHAEVVGIADLNIDKARVAGAAYGVERVYTDYHRMFDVEKPDGVIVATNHLAHFDVSKEALSRGMGVLVEKPMVKHARCSAWPNSRAYR